jgi:hypothetical protein
MFIEVLFTIAKLWDQPRFPSTNEQRKKIWHLYTYNGVLVSHNYRRIKLWNLQENGCNWRASCLAKWVRFRGQRLNVFCHMQNLGHIYVYIYIYRYTHTYIHINMAIINGVVEKWGWGQKRKENDERDSATLHCVYEWRWHKAT